MNNITKREAVHECKKLWKAIEESGLTKYGFLNSPEGQVWRNKHYIGNCPLCECYNCRSCPLIIQYGKECIYLGFDDHGPCDKEWFKAIRDLKE